MLKKYLHISFLYVTIFISITLNAYLYNEVNTFYEKTYYVETLFNNSKLGFLTTLKCE
jgi:hypothetical protein